MSVFDTIPVPDGDLSWMVKFEHPSKVGQLVTLLTPDQPDVRLSSLSGILCPGSLKGGETAVVLTVEKTHPLNEASFSSYIVEIFTSGGVRGWLSSSFLRVLSDSDDEEESDEDHE